MAASPDGQVCGGGLRCDRRSVAHFTGTINIPSFGTLDYLDALGADVWLGAHPFVNRTLQKYERLQAGEKPSPFIDRKGWRQFLKVKRIGFEKLVAERAEELKRLDQRK